MGADQERAGDVAFGEVAPWVETPTCGATRGGGRVACELPPGHGPNDDLRFDHPTHLGRGRDGRWLSWPI